MSGSGRPTAGARTPVCDFCLRPDPEWEYPAAPVPLPTHPTFTVSLDNFGACEDCRWLIDTRDLEGLAHRIVTLQPHHVPEGTVVDDGVVHYRPLLSRLHDARLAVAVFMAAKQGPAMRYVP
jgi:hypothetical protein